MLISQCGASSDAVGHGCPPAGLADLRRQLAHPSPEARRHRQRLRELAQRLTRVQALGDEYARVDLSPAAKAALAAAAGAA